MTTDSSVSVFRLETTVEIKVNGVVDVARVARDLEKLISKTIHDVYSERGVVSVRDTYSIRLR